MFSLCVELSTPRKWICRFNYIWKAQKYVLEDICRYIGNLKIGIYRLVIIEGGRKVSWFLKSRSEKGKKWNEWNKIMAEIQNAYEKVIAAINWWKTCERKLQRMHCS